MEDWQKTAQGKKTVHQILPPQHSITSLLPLNTPLPHSYPLNTPLPHSYPPQHSITTLLPPSILHYYTPTPSTLHYPTPPCPSLPSQLSKVCEISKPSYAVAFSGSFQERHTNYQQPTKSKVHVPQMAGVFPLYSHKMQ